MGLCQSVDKGQMLRMHCEANQEYDVEMLIKKSKGVTGFVCDVDPATGKTAAHICCEKGAVGCLTLCMNAGLSPNVVDPQGDTPAHLAARYGTNQAFEFLNEHKANFLAKNKAQKTPLNVAIETTLAGQGQLPSIRALLVYENNPQSSPVNVGISMHMAAASNKADALKLLLNSKYADINRGDVEGKGNTPLHTAAQSGAIHCAHLLMTVGCDVNRPNTENNTTAAHFAAHAGHAQLLQLLCEKGAKVNLQNKAGNAPLHNAARAGRLECIHILVAFGANVNLADANGKTPLAVAEAANKTEAAELLKKLGGTPPDLSLQVRNHAKMGNNQDLIKTIREFNLNNSKILDEQDPATGATALIFAVDACVDHTGEPEEVIQTLIGAGACRLKIDKQGQSVIHHAAAVNKKILELVVGTNSAETTPLLTARDSDNMTPFMVAAREGRVGCLRYLTDLKVANPTVDMDRNGW